MDIINKSSVQDTLPSIEMWTGLERPRLRLSDSDAVLRVHINPADREYRWLDHVVLLPWFAPQRVLGFVHPRMMEKVGQEPFMLHAACMYNANHALQPVNGNQMRVVEGPKITLPYDLIDPMNIRIYRCPSAIFLADQSPRTREVFAAMLIQVLAPTQIELADPGKVPPQRGQRG